MTTRSRTEWSSSPRFGWVEVTGAIVTYVVLLVVISAVILRTPDDYAALRGIFSMASNGIAGIAAVLVACLLRIRDMRAFGFRVTSCRWLLIGAALGVLAYVLSHVVEGIYFHFVTEPNTQGDFQAAATGGLWSFGILLFTGALLTPLGEEAVFRGVIGNVLNRYGPWAGVVGSAAIFAAAHGPSVIFLDAFLVGILTGILLRKTGSVWPGLATHVIYNGLWLTTYALA
ncbi:type II CAAX endopeptidase family protein [Pseudochrobactrum sp. B5]|uniref:CPBP family intramembrane glutamic endopeptidase n=1 Tax=Pseudochrobactrum sp. B5 TaxID=1289478 RepID=UPI0009535336|nr:type II CAAX endopeptidase family protein [Pseudochrobactrum sp. B5]